MTEQHYVPSITRFDGDWCAPRNRRGGTRAGGGSTTPRTKYPMTQTEQRHIVLGAARSELRRLKMPLDPYAISFEDVLAVLDDLCRVEPDLVASQWYRQASEHEIRLLRREWLRQRHTDTSAAGRWRPRKRMITTSKGTRARHKPHHSREVTRMMDQNDEQQPSQEARGEARANQHQQEALPGAPRFLVRYRQDAHKLPWEVYDSWRGQALAAYSDIAYDAQGQPVFGEWLTHELCAALNAVADEDELAALLAELEEIPPDEGHLDKTPRAASEDVPDAPSAELWNALPPKEHSRLGYGATIFCIVLLVACLVFQVVLIAVTPPITVILFPKTQIITVTAHLFAVADTTATRTGQSIHGHLLAPLTLSQTATAPATGMGHQDARAASGQITFYNGAFTSQTVPAGTILTGADGTQVVTEQGAVIPAGNPPIYGAVTVAAHAIQAGARGNIPALDINQACCASSVLAKNQAAFTGGQEARDFQAVTQANISGVASTLKAALGQSMQGALQARLTPGEALYSLPCPPSVRPDHQPGDEASQVHVTVSAACAGIAYHQDELQASATQLLSAQATRRLGAGYSLLGQIQAQVTQAAVEQATVTLTMRCQGTWVYQLSEQAQAHLLSLLGGRTKQQALHTLAHLPGIARATIEGIADNQRLPKDSSAIHLLVLYLEKADGPGLHLLWLRVTLSV